METFLQNCYLISFLPEVARTWKLFHCIATYRINGKNCKFFKQFTRLLRNLFKKSGEKKICLKLLNFCDLKHNNGNFQRHRVWMAFKLAMEISTVKMVLIKEYFLRHFSHKAKWHRRREIPLLLARTVVTK